MLISLLLAGVFVHLLKDAAKVPKVLRATLTLGPLGVIQEAAHTLQAGGVERFQNVEGGEEERAGTACGV